MTNSPAAIHKERVFWFHPPKIHFSGESAQGTGKILCCERCCAVGYQIYGHPDCYPLSTCGPQPLRSRGEVEAFGRIQEKRMRANDDRPGWRPGTVAIPISAKAALAGIQSNLKILNHWLVQNPGVQPPDVILRHAADVGNYAMMLAFVAGGLVE